MFKKTLLAATIAVVSTGAMAVDVATGSATVKFGSEALVSGVVKNDFTALTTPTIALTLGASYTPGDLIKVQLAGGKFKKTDTFTLTSSSRNAADTAAGTASVTTGFLSASDTELVFRVTDVVAGGVGDVVTLTLGTPAVMVNSTAVGAKVTVSASAETNSGVAIDVAGKDDSKDIISVVQEHKFVSTKLTANIDVADERKSLTGTTDAFTVTYSQTTVDTSADFPLADVSYTVNGSFTGFEKGITGATNLGVVSYDHKAAGDVDAKATADLQTIKLSALAAPADGETTVFTFTPDAAKATRVVLNASAYTTDVVIKSGTTTFDYAGLASGAFTLNGSNAQYAYVPVNYNGAVTTQFEIGNKGKVDGEITLTAFDTDGNTYSKTLEKKAEAGKLTKLSDADISTAFGLTKGTKLNLTITVNAPATDVTYGAYSNRGTTGRMAINKL